MKVVFNTVTKYLDSENGIEDDDFSYELKENEIYIEVGCELFHKYNCINDRLGFIKQQKISELKKSFENQVSLGYTDSQTGIVLALGDSDMMMFNNLLTMLKLAEELGQTTSSTQIADINGVLHELPILNLKVILLYYGGYYNAIWTEFVNKQNFINNSENAIELIDYIVD